MHSNIFKKLLFQQFIASLLLGLALSRSSQAKEFDYAFMHQDNAYSFRGNFFIQAEAECLLDRIFHFEHLAEFAAGAKSIDLIRHGENWHEVAYTYRKFLIFETHSTWRRTLKRAQQQVVFEMISNQNNLDLMPTVLSSKGYYQISAEADGYRVEYFQECRLKSSYLLAAYMNQLEKEAIKFLREFKACLEKACSI